jgi:hypothetical protein
MRKLGHRNNGRQGHWCRTATGLLVQADTGTLTHKAFTHRDTRIPGHWGTGTDRALCQCDTHLSSTVLRTPNLPRRSASVSPTGPPPTITTSDLFVAASLWPASRWPLRNAEGDAASSLVLAFIALPAGAGASAQRADDETTPRRGGWIE